MAGLQQNNSALNRAALRWLKEVKAPAPDHYLHLLNLAEYGMQMQVAAGWPNRAELQEQLNNLFGWKAANALHWLLTNPEAPSKEEQSASLHRLLDTADDAASAAHHVLETILSRQVGQNPALQPAASDSSWSEQEQRNQANKPPKSPRTSTTTTGRNG
jgi:hypothetical protein